MVLNEFGRAQKGDWDGDVDYISSITQEAIDDQYTKIRLTSEMPELDITILFNANMELVKFECFEDDLELIQALLMEYLNRTSDRWIEENSKKQAILNTLKGV